MLDFLRTHYRHPQFREGLADMSSVALGIAAWGLMTGVTMVKAGLGTLEALLMSVLVFAGSAQLSAIPLLAANAPMWVILATAFCVNLRFVVFSAHMRPYVMHLPRPQRLLLGYLCGDLSYVMFVKRFPKSDVDPDERVGQIAYLLGNTGLNWASWVGTSVAGVVLANFIPTHWGLGFAGILALTGLLCSLASSRLRAVSAIVAGAAAVACFALPLRMNILAAIAAAVLVCLLLEKTSLAHARQKGVH